MSMVHHTSNGWIISVHGREVDTVKTVHGQHPTAGRALALSLDGGLDTLLTKDVAADSRRRIDQLVRADWAAELWFLWEILRRCRACLSYLRLWCLAKH